MSADRDEPPAGSSKEAVRQKLEFYRDFPPNTEDTKDNDLTPLIWRLMHSAEDIDGRYHWFCHRADTLTHDLATFLLRLFAYKSEVNSRAKRWRDRMIFMTVRI